MRAALPPCLRGMSGRSDRRAAPRRCHDGHFGGIARCQRRSYSGSECGPGVPMSELALRGASGVAQRIGCVVATLAVGGFVKAQLFGEQPS